MQFQWRRFNRHIRGIGLYGPLLGITSVLFLLILPFDESVTWIHASLFLAINALFWLGIPVLNNSVGPRWFNWALIGGFALMVHFALVFTGGQSSLFYYLYYPVIFYTAFTYGLSGVVPLVSLITLLYSSLFWGDAMHTFVVRTAQLALGGLMLGFLSEEKRSSERRLGIYAERLINSIGSGMIVTDMEGHIQSLNRAAENILGYSGSELNGKRIDHEISIHPEGVSPVLDALTKRENQERIDTTMMKRSGELLPAGGSVYLLEEEGELIGAVEIFRDLTEIKAREAQIERQRRLVALGGMAAEVAHEVRNPLGGIKGFASLLARKVQDETARKYVARITEGVESIEQVVTDFLLYARPMEPRIRLADLHQLLDTCLLLSVEQSDSVQVERRYVEGLAKLSMDPEQMRQVFMNLMINADQSMPDGGCLSVATQLVQPSEIPGRAQGEHVEIRISDTGAGIPAEIRERIFDPFYTTKDTGTGLGLAIVYRIVEAHQGVIRAEENGELGTTFVLELPIQQPANAGKYQET